MTDQQETGWAAVVGHPIGHSLSPVLHGAAYGFLGAGPEYRRRDLQAPDFSRVVDGWAVDPAWRGLSVTMPLKAEAYHRSRRRTAFAEVLGVANTLWPVRDESGSTELWAHNTDVGGIVNALRDAGAEPGAGGACAVIGGGGTATAAVAAARVMGVGAVVCYVRSPERAAGASETAARLGLPLEFRPLDQASAEMSAFPLVLCTLPSRAFDETASRLAGDFAGTTVLDVSYDPWPSALARAVADRGGSVASGKQMLLHQALDQVKLFTGRPLDRPLPGQSELLARMADAVGVPAPAQQPWPVHTDEQLLPAS